MKKWIVGFLCILLLAGCSEKEKVGSHTENTEFEEVENIDLPETTGEVEVEEEIQSENEIEIPEADELLSRINEVLLETGMSEPIDFENKEYYLEEVAGIIRISVNIDGNNGKPLKIFCTKENYDDWYIASISNCDTGNVYWTDESNLEFTDLYDYETDELIQEKEHSYEEVLKEIRSEWEKEVNELLGEQEEIKKQAEDLTN